jgi:hypothetical protein
MNVNTEEIIKEAMPILKAIAANMIKDGIADKFISMSAEARSEITKGYFADQIRKNEKMQTMFMTNPEFKAHFTKMVLASF